MATQAPGAEPDEAWQKRFTDGSARQHGRSRPTFDKSPVRESRMPGSVRGAASNGRPYRDRPSGRGTGQIYKVWRAANLAEQGEAS
jgi:hypothetical protein